MKRIISIITILFFYMSLPAQYYCLPNTTNPGNPLGLNPDPDYPVGGGMATGWTSLLGPSIVTPTWTSNQTIPFSFNFNGTPVTQYKVSSTGILTFDTSATTAPASTNNAIPNNTIPDNSIMVWGIECSGANDYMVTKTFGTPGNQQHWILFSSFTPPFLTNDWSYWSIVLEEGTDNIYIVDQRSNGTVALTAGIQIDAMTAFSVPGSPSLSTLGTNDPTDADNYYYTFIFGTQAMYDAAGTAMTTSANLILANAPFTISGEITNLGSATINSMDINYSVDGGPTVTQSLTNLNIATFGSHIFNHANTWTPTTTGTYQIEIWASNINGNVDANPQNDRATGSVQVFSNVVQRIPLIETFTSSTCPPCNAANVTAEALFANNPGELTSIKYQADFPGTGDPYWTQEGGNRRSYYAITSVPRMEIDGGWDGNGNSITQQIFDDYSAIPAFVNLSATFSVNGQTISVDATIDPVEDILSNSLYLHMAIFEETTFNNVKTNGETQFEHVVKKMLPDENGTMLQPLQSGVQQTVSQQFTFQGSYRLPPDATSMPINDLTEHSVEEFFDLGVAVWIQNASTKEVHQSTTAIETTPSSTTEMNMAQISIYPNPTKDKINISGEYDLIEIYDAFGKLVLKSNKQKKINVSELSNGIYLLDIVTNNQNITKKISINR